jgi:hypothetical protein
VLRNCRFAVALYKNVAERGRWTERFMDAYLRFQAGAVDEAAFRYLFLAELGYEAAQTNFAYLVWFLIIRKKNIQISKFLQILGIKFIPKINF